MIKVSHPFALFYLVRSNFCNLMPSRWLSVFSWAFFFTHPSKNEFRPRKNIHLLPNSINSTDWFKVPFCSQNLLPLWFLSSDDLYETGSRCTEFVAKTTGRSRVEFSYKAFFQVDGLKEHLNKKVSLTLTAAREKITLPSTLLHSISGAHMQAAVPLPRHNTYQASPAPAHILASPSL